MDRKPLKPMNLRKNEQHKCKVCGKIFKTIYLCIRHEKIHKKNIYICNCCGFRYTSRYTLIKHLSHSQKQKFNCSVCGIGFCEDRLLFNHIRRTHFNLEGIQTCHSSKKVNETWVERVLKTEVYVEMTKLTPNAVIIKKYVKNDDMKIDYEKVKKSRDIKSENNIRNTTKLKSKTKLDLTGKTIKKKEVESGKYKDKFSPYSVYGNYSEGKCEHCGKNMLKKSLVNHIRERHLKLRRFTCKKCKRSFNRRYQMVDHCCDTPRRRPRDS